MFSASRSVRGRPRAPRARRRRRVRRPSTAGGEQRGRAGPRGCPLRIGRRGSVGCGPVDMYHFNNMLRSYTTASSALKITHC